MAAVAGNPSVTCGDSSAQGTPFGCPKGEPSNTNLQTPYEIKLPTYTRKRLNINVTNTGKGNNRRWQATGGQRGQRANSAGRFRHGSPRSYTSRVNLSTSLQNAIQNKVTHLYWKTSEYQHYRYRQGQQPALASHRRTARATSDSAGRFRHGCTRTHKQFTQQAPLKGELAAIG